VVPFSFYFCRHSPPLHSHSVSHTSPLRMVRGQCSKFKFGQDAILFGFKRVALLLPSTMPFCLFACHPPLPLPHTTPTPHTTTPHHTHTHTTPHNASTHHHTRTRFCLCTPHATRRFHAHARALLHTTHAHTRTRTHGRWCRVDLERAVHSVWTVLDGGHSDQDIDGLVGWLSISVVQRPSSCVVV